MGIYNATLHKTLSWETEILIIADNEIEARELAKKHLQRDWCDAKKVSYSVLYAEVEECEVGGGHET